MVYKPGIKNAPLKSIKDLFQSPLIGSWFINSDKNDRKKFEFESFQSPLIGSWFINKLLTLRQEDLLLFQSPLIGSWFINKSLLRVLTLYHLLRIVSIPFNRVMVYKLNVVTTIW